MERASSLTQGSISHCLLNFAVPGLLTNVLAALSTSVNSIWIGRFLGEAALTATANANTVLLLLVGASFGLTASATILIGRYIGANDLNAAKRVVGTSASFFAAVSMLIAALGLPLSTPLLVAMGTPMESLQLAAGYLRIIFLSIPLVYMFAFIMSALRGTGDARTPFWFMLMTVVIGAALNPLFIFGIGPVPRFGIAGAAWATFVAQGIGLAALVSYLYRTNDVLALRRRDFAMLRVDWGIVGVLVRKGVPMGSEILVASLRSVLMITLVNRFDVETTAAFGATLQVWSYVLMPGMAISMAVSVMVSQNVGAERWDRVRATARAGTVYGVAVTLGAAVVISFFGASVLGIFLPDESNALPIAEHLNQIVVWSFVPMSFAMVLFGVMRATGAVVMPLLISSVALLLVRFPLAASLLQHWQADAIWWSFTISAVLEAVLAALCYNFGRWRASWSVSRPA